MFRGAFLDAGADAIGTRDLPLPARAPFDRFRASRLAYFSGAQDEAALQLTTDSVASLRRWCARRPVTRTEAGMGHDIAPPSALAWALAALDRTEATADAGGDCRSRIDGDVRADLVLVRSALASGDAARARRLLAGVDERFGGLAAPESVALAQALAAPTK